MFYFCLSENSASTIKNIFRFISFRVLAIGKIFCITSKSFSNKNFGCNNTLLKVRQTKL